MNQLKYITNLKPILEGVYIKSDGSILQSDVSKIFLINAKPKNNQFGGKEFVLSDISKNEKFIEKLEKLEETDMSLEFSGKDRAFSYIKSQVDAISEDEKLLALPGFTNGYKDPAKLILTNEVKEKLKELIDSGLGEHLVIYTDNGIVKSAIGGQQGKNKLVCNLSETEKNFKLTINVTFLKSLLDSIKGFSELYIQTNEALLEIKKTIYPLKVTDKTDDYDTEIYVATREHD